MGGNDTAIRGVAPGGDDRLSEHLTSLDNGSSRGTAGGAREAAVAVVPHVQHIDQVLGVAPRGEALDCGASVVPLRTVDDLDAHTLRIECAVSDQLTEIDRRILEGPQDVASVPIGRFLRVPGVRVRRVGGSSGNVGAPEGRLSLGARSGR